MGRIFKQTHRHEGTALAVHIGGRLLAQLAALWVAWTNTVPNKGLREFRKQAIEEFCLAFNVDVRVKSNSEKETAKPAV